MSHNTQESEFEKFLSGSFIAQVYTIVLFPLVFLLLVVAQVMQLPVFRPRISKHVINWMHEVVDVLGGIYVKLGGK